MEEIVAGDVVILAAGASIPADCLLVESQDLYVDEAALTGEMSSLFDCLTFVILLLVFKSNVEHFRTAWFLESEVSATLVVLIVRTRRPLLRSRPSKLLVLSTLLAIVVTVSLPWTPLAGVLGFAPLPAPLLVVVAVIVVGYVVSAELAKAVFFRKPASRGLALSSLRRSR